MMVLKKFKIQVLAVFALNIFMIAPSWATPIKGKVTIKGQIIKVAQTDGSGMREIPPTEELYNYGCDLAQCLLSTQDKAFTFRFPRLALTETARYDSRGGSVSSHQNATSGGDGSELGSASPSLSRTALPSNFYQPTAEARAGLPRVDGRPETLPTLSEIATGGSTTIASPDYRPEVSASSFLSCYRSTGIQYPSRRSCTSGDRLRTGCGGSKSPTRSTGYCYRYVKLILQDCGAASGYLSGVYAKNAGPELLRAGFRKLNVSSPRQAPPGAVLVYGNRCSSLANQAGHIEIKISESQYISDYVGSRPISESTTCRPFLGAYIK